MESWDQRMITILTGAATMVTVIIAAVSLVLVFVSQMDAQRAELRSEQRADIAGLREDQRADIADLRADIADLRADLRGMAERIDRSGMRVTQVELDQARLDATNEILLRQTHTHAGEE